MLLLLFLPSNFFLPLDILGVDYSKNGNKVSKFFKINYSRRVSSISKKTSNSNYKRIYSLFNVGLILFNLVYESPHYFKLKFNFHLYDL